MKRTASGEITDLRFIEVKTRQAIPEFQLSVTRNHGAQLSDDWLQNNLQRLVVEHPDAGTRRVAEEALEVLRTRPALVRREVHGIVVQADRYAVLSVDDLGRVTGEVSHGRLTSLLKTLSTRGASDETRAAAARHLARFDQLRTIAGQSADESLQLVRGGANAVHTATERAAIVASARPMSSRGALVKSWDEARAVFGRIAKAPGVLAAGLTFAVDEGLTAWEYHRGGMSSGDFQRKTAQNATKAVAVGAATQVVYILMATPHGLVLVGVGVVTYLAVDQAIKAYDDAFLPQLMTMEELRGIIPDSCIDVKLIGESLSRGD